MITEDQLATAFIAKLAGSTLKEVDDNTTHQSSTGPATKIDPKQFLPGIQQIQQNHQAAMIAQINRAAELAHPIPPPLPTVIQQPVVVQQQPEQDQNQLTFDFNAANDSESIKLLRQIRDSITEIATLIRQNNAKNSS